MLISTYCCIDFISWSGIPPGFNYGAQVGVIGLLLLPAPLTMGDMGSNPIGVTRRANITEEVWKALKTRTNP
ncbi:hypothetical protein GOP47_0029235 [Adiantum capillus-veneris]|nr:hypothetical protein GOP47_0029235 [Adiantum capillus-veneris]